MENTTLDLSKVRIDYTHREPNVDFMFRWERDMADQAAKSSLENGLVVYAIDPTKIPSMEVAAYLQVLAEDSEQFSTECFKSGMSGASIGYQKQSDAAQCAMQLLATTETFHQAFKKAERTPTQVRQVLLDVTRTLEQRLRETGKIVVSRSEAFSRYQ